MLKKRGNLQLGGHVSLKPKVHTAKVPWCVCVYLWAWRQLAVQVAVVAVHPSEGLL